MNRKEINQSDMLQSVDKHLTTNATLIQNQPALVSAHNRLKAIITDIFEYNQRQSAGTTTDTLVKNNQKRELIQVIMKVTGAMAAHAAATDDVKLKAAATVSESVLKGMRENDLVVKGNAIYTAAQPVAAALESWGVTAADLTLLGADLEGFKQKSPEIRNLQVQSTQATASLKDKLDEAKALLKDKIDPMMLPFKSLQPAFYAEYQNVRTIVDRAAGHNAGDEKPA